MTITSLYLALCSSTSSLAQRAGFFYAAGAFRLSFQVDTNACLACPLPLKEDTLGPTTAFDSDLGQAEKARATPRLALVSVADASLRYPVEMRRTVFFYVCFCCCCCCCRCCRLRRCRRCRHLRIPAPLPPHFSSHIVS